MPKSLSPATSTESPAAGSEPPTHRRTDAPTHRPPISHLRSPISDPPSRRTSFLGCPVDLLTGAQLLAELEEAIAHRLGPRVIQFVNANKVAQVCADPHMGEILQRADYVLMDGQPLVPMARMLGIRVPERIDGIGLMRKLLALAHQHSHSVFFLGARQEVVTACVERVRAQFPGIRIAGFRNGYFAQAEAQGITHAIQETRPDIVFLGMGTPMKEHLADTYRNHFGATVIQGVGGSFDVMAGLVRRAPLWIQRLGFEWLYRVLQEPRRMAWRYAKTNSVCLCLFARAWLRRAVGRRRNASPRPERKNQALDPAP